MNSCDIIKKGKSHFDENEAYYNLNEFLLFSKTISGKIYEL